MTACGRACLPAEVISPLAVCCDSALPEVIARAAALALRLDLPLTACDSDAYPLLLVLTDERLEVRQPARTVGPVYAEFDAGRFGYRRTLPLRRELLARAVGFKGEPIEVVDMTAGLGRDAMLLALLGCRVTAIESNPVVFELLADGLRRARRDEDMARVIDERLRLIRGDAVDYLATLSDQTPDAIYLDPMFPARTRSAQVKKEMVLLARLTGDPEHGDDAGRLLAAALGSGCRRVVTKRPRHAPPLLVPGGPAPTTRFDGTRHAIRCVLPGRLVCEVGPRARRSGGPARTQSVLAR